MQADICYVVSLLLITVLNSWRGWSCFFVPTSSTLGCSTRVVSDRKASRGLLGTGYCLWAQKPFWFLLGLTISFIPEKWHRDSDKYFNKSYLKRKAGLIRAWSYWQDVSAEHEYGGSEAVMFPTLGYCVLLIYGWHRLLLQLRYLISVHITSLTSEPGQLESPDRLPVPQTPEPVVVMQVSGGVHVSGDVQQL